MKKLTLVFALLLIASFARAQLVVRNSGPDTLQIAIGTFYDTSKKVIKAAGPLEKPVVVRGWYRLNPGDSVVVKKFAGPAVYCSRQRIRQNKYIVGDSLGLYREDFYTPKTSILSDTSKFSIVHPIRKDADKGRYASNFFRVFLIPEEAKKSGRFVIEL
jgi:hypothetical protein